MEIRQLTFFRAAVDAGSISGAARCCGVTQPSLSQQIARLEEELGVRLFDRLGPGIALTPAGRELDAHARRILTAEQAARRSVRDAASPDAQRFALGVIPSVASCVVPDALARVHAAFPDSAMQLLIQSSASLMRAVAEAELDMALVIQPVTDPRLLSHDVAVERLLLATPPGVEVDEADPLESLDVRASGVILVDDPDGPPDLLGELSQRLGVRPRVRAPWGALDVILGLVDRGLGVALLPELFACGVAGGPRRLWALPPGAPHRTLACIWHVGRERSPLARAVVEAIGRSCRAFAFAGAPGRR
jgi:DNA-binding transcriptional LysR family regulator